MYISYAEKLKTENDAEKTTPWTDMSIQGVIDALHAGCIKPACRASTPYCRMLHPAAGRRRRELTAAFQWRWPHLERHAACMQASCRSHFQIADRIFPNAACMSLVYARMQPAYDGMQDAAGCSRLHASCMKPACRAHASLVWTRHKPPTNYSNYFIYFLKLNTAKPVKEKPIT